MTVFALQVVAPSNDYEALHQTLAYFNRDRLTPQAGDSNWHNALAHEHEMKHVEGEFIERERRTITALATAAPLEPYGFIAWFEELAQTGPGQGDALFPWLAEQATAEEMRWFLHQEVSGEAGFEDLLALTQVKFPVRPKLELARNFWDGMGRGDERGMHGPMLSRLVATLDLAPTPETTVWESLALANLMVGLAANRRYAYQSIGALGVIELTAPGRAAFVATGLRRLGLSGKARVYFELHSTLDIRHSGAWNCEILWPLVSADSRLCRPIAEGALLRLTAGARCFARYRRELGRQ